MPSLFHLSFRAALILACGLPCLPLIASDAPKNEGEKSKVPDTELLWQEYERNPDAHPNLPNCSYAGYHYGEKPIPHLKGPVFDVTQYGAKGDGVEDDSAAIRAAITAVGEKGGVVYFPNGTYNVSRALFVHTNGTVLRGESRDGTEIRFTRPLDTALGTAFYPANIPAKRATKWNYSGGLIWFGPKDCMTYPAEEQVGSPIKPKMGWVAIKSFAKITAPARRGQRTVSIESPLNVKPGDFVLLRQSNPPDYSLLKHLSGGGEWADQFPWKDGPVGAGWPDYTLSSTLQWMVEVVEATENSLTFYQPLRFDLRPEWNPRLIVVGSLVRESGIENMTLRFMRDFTWKKSENHHLDRGWNAPFFNNAVHCWLRDVTMVDMENGPGIASSKCITLTGFTLKASSPERMQHHHGTTTRSSSFDNLISDFRIESMPLHGLNVEGMSSGNVWSRGVLTHGIFDSHRMMPFENIRTEIILVNNDGFHGGARGPLMGARFAHWNVKVESGRSYIVDWANSLPTGALVGLQGIAPSWAGQPESTPQGEVSKCRVESSGKAPNPANLYEAELALRLKSRK